MKVSLRWLSELVDLSNLSLETIVNKIIAAGFEVEEISHLGQGTNLVVGEVIACQKHPDSDHLHITKVNIGDKILQIVCGAKNVRTGIRVIVAQDGSILPGGKIKVSQLRKTTSEGMLCSLLELGVCKSLLDEKSTSHFGIEELPSSFKIGEKDILNKLGYEDTILDLAIYANRSDCLAMFSLAKEIAAILNRPINLPIIKSISSNERADYHVSLKTNNCSYYLGKVIKKVVVKESPVWLKAHLRSNGIASINNVVDISNYVMLETGQPLHFFDLTCLKTKEISVCDDYEGSYLALDGNTYQLLSKDLVIKNGQEVIAIAGIMGGQESKIKESTTSIYIESAAFNAATIRRSANRLGLQTDAAIRFIKGLDPLAQEKALNRAIALLREYAEADFISETIVAGENKYQPQIVKESLTHLNSLIGKEFTMDEVLDILKRLDFSPKVNNDLISCTIPSYRSFDIKLREDLDEEIIRLSNFDDLKSTLPNLKTTIGRLSPLQKARRLIRNYLSVNGFNECVTYTLVSEKDTSLNALNLGTPIALASPLSDAHKYIRTSLLSSLANCLIYNLNYGNENLKLFELSRVYSKESNEERLALLLHGSYLENLLLNSKLESNYFILKGILFSLFKSLGYSETRLKINENINEKVFHPYRSALLLLDKEVVAVFGELHPNLLNHKRLGRCLYAEILLEKALAIKPNSIKVSNINKFPAVSRDLSLVVSKDITAYQILQAVRKALGSVLTDINIFDIYEGEKIEAYKKSVSLTLTYESKDHTLVDSEIVSLQEKAITSLETLLGAKLRN